MAGAAPCTINRLLWLQTLDDETPLSGISDILMWQSSMRSPRLAAGGSSVHAGSGWMAGGSDGSMLGQPLSRTATRVMAVEPDAGWAAPGSPRCASGPGVSRSGSQLEAGTERRTRGGVPGPTGSQLPLARAAAVLGGDASTSRRLSGTGTSSASMRTGASALGAAVEHRSTAADATGDQPERCAAAAAPLPGGYSTPERLTPARQRPQREDADGEATSCSSGAPVGLLVALSASEPGRADAAPHPTAHIASGGTSSNAGIDAAAACQSPRHLHSVAGSEKQMPQSAPQHHGTLQGVQTPAAAAAYQLQGPPRSAASDGSCTGSDVPDHDWAAARQLLTAELARMHQSGFTPGVDEETLQVLQRQATSDLAAAGRDPAAKLGATRSTYSGVDHVGERPGMWNHARTSEVSARPAGCLPVHVANAE